MLLIGDARSRLTEVPSASVQTVVTSPPYWGLRDYGTDGQIGLEDDPADYVDAIVAVFREVRRVLKDDGTVWLNLGDSYAGGGRGGQSAEKRSEGWQPTYALPDHIPKGFKNKDLIGIPWRVAIALQTDGWHLRQDLIWEKPNAMPEPVTDRCTKAHEYLFLLSKNFRYKFNHEVMLEPADNGGTRNRRSVWTIPTERSSHAHFAVMPEALCEPCVLAGSAAGDTVLDPFLGSGTTAVVAQRLHRQWIGCELNTDYAELAQHRISTGSLTLPF